jgi:hypothetical protein
VRLKTLALRQTTAAVSAVLPESAAEDKSTNLCVRDAGSQVWSVHATSLGISCSTNRNNRVVGAGHSGAKAAAALRKHGWTGTITLIGDEAHVPYDRKALSSGSLICSAPNDES